MTRQLSNMWNDSNLDSQSVARVQGDSEKKYSNAKMAIFT